MIAALAALLLLAPPAAEPAASARDLARKVQSFYERTQSLQASFVQTYTYAALGRAQVSRGTLLVKKPGKMRWDYAEPATKVIAVSGSRLVQYEPEANQAFVNDQFDASAMSAAVTFLLGRGRLDKEFDLSLGAGGKLVLTPKQPDPRVASVALTVGPDGEVTATRVEDGTGNVNEIVFSAMKRNPHLADSAFEVKLPKDVHLVEAPGAGR
jgi:outer membrane lipoprotein carrier protein